MYKIVAYAMQDGLYAVVLLDRNGAAWLAGEGERFPWILSPLPDPWQSVFDYGYWEETGDAVVDVPTYQNIWDAWAGAGQAEG